MLGLLFFEARLLDLLDKFKLILDLLLKLLLFLDHREHFDLLSLFIWLIFFVGSVLFNGHDSIELLVIQKQNFFVTQAEILPVNFGVLESGKYCSSSYNILVVQVMVFFKKIVQVLLLLSVSHFVFFYILNRKGCADCTF